MKVDLNKPIYCIPGLGVNYKVFSRIDLPNLKFVDWIEPKRKESFEDYCFRLSTQIKSNHINLIGLSFGGLIAQEVSKLINVENLFIISSIKSSEEKPKFFELMKYLPLYNLNHKILRDNTKLIWSPFFGLKNKKEIDFFYRMMPEMSDYYLNWSIKQICHWEKIHRTNNLIQIHGSDDLIFPVENIEINKNTHIIKDATHTMVYTHGRQVTEIIKKHLK